jgi:hypothetical protein
MRAATAWFALAAWLPVAAAAQEPAPIPIQDNSFLVEEAYNQEGGVVQHINTLLRARRSWSYSLTQEWPLGGQRHQLSFSVPIEGGVGDVAINYRHQLTGLGGGGRAAFAPRLSLLLPTADGGSPGLQVNLPVSAMLTRGVVSHWNAGATLTRSEETVYNGGASVIWLARPSVNFMVELVWAGSARSGEVIVNPGLRWAHNLGRLQIVPGISFPDGRDVFFYVSFEHPFTSTGPTPVP